MTSWTGPPLPQLRHPSGLRDWSRVLRRGAPMAVVVFGGLAVLLLCRLVERPLCGMRRPVTPHITQTVCRLSLRLLGLRHHVEGQILQGEGACVANHGSWLDIFALNAGKRIYFVAKSEVAGWPGIGWLARATGTLFIRRDRREARAQAALLETRLKAGHRLMFFPEGTSTDARRVLPFKPTLFAAFFAEGLRDRLQVQPVSVLYFAPEGERADLYGWWGAMSFGGHLLAMLTQPKHGRVEVIYHPPLRVADFEDRKALAAEAERQVRERLRVGLGKKVFTEDFC